MRKLIAPLSLVLGLLGVMLLGFTVSAHAAQAASPDDGNLLDLARPVFDQIMAGHYIASAALCLVLAVALVKRYAPTRFQPFLHSDAGHALTTLAMAFGGALATATIGGAPWHWGMLTTAGGVAVTAVGGLMMVEHLLVEPLLKPLIAKLPPWAQPIAGIIMWIFDKPASQAQIDANATKAGDAAVAATPSTGAAGVVGPAKEI